VFIGDASNTPALTRIFNRALPAFARLRWQIPIVVLLCGAVPGAIVDIDGFWNTTDFSSASNAFYASLFSSLVGLLLFRRLGSFPGITSFGQIAPSVAGPYLIAVVAFMLLRLDYSRPILLLSAFMAFVVYFGFWAYARRMCVPTLYVLPGTSFATSVPKVKILRLSEPPEVLERNGIVVADLRSHLAPKWEAFLLASAMHGVPVCQAKILQESLTGKVEIEHLAENSFGSVIPNQLYLRVKRLVDVTVSICVLPLLLGPMLLIAIAIRLDSPGPAFFIQKRMGYRQQAFRVMKFRTMVVENAQSEPLDDRERARTMTRDPRVTRVGRFLRRYRLDELPQIINIIRGEMSWIGPRPEASELSEWYHREIPFYAYRHMVRPGITGWAQVHQGHVHDVVDVKHKLHYDFYYIKYFSAWLDMLIVLRTLRVIIFGHGAR